MKNIKYWERQLKLKLIKFIYLKDQIEQYTRMGSPVQTWANSESTNSDPMQNNHINNHRTRKNIKKYDQKI